MTIVDVRVHCLQIPTRPAFPPAVHEGAASRHTLIEVETDDGLVGAGEAFRLAPEAVKALIRDDLRPLLIGQPEAEIHAMAAALRRHVFRFGRTGIAMMAISGIEVALWDILGQRAGLPLVDLLGGRCRPDLRAYASLPRYGSPRDAAFIAARCVEDGFGGVKLHQSDPAFAGEVRAAIGPDVALMFDAGGAWTPRDALDAAHVLAVHDVLWLEEPVSAMADYAGIAWLASRSPVRIAGGENEYGAGGFVQPIERRSFDVLQPDIIKCGGISETRKILALAEAHNIEVALHCYCHGPGLLATAHLSLATPGIEWLEIVPTEIAIGVLDAPLRVIDGKVCVPDTPGLGAKLDYSTFSKPQI
ncbi:mandelate racemase/muconate lactonizing enzyme family protein [Ancylobacter terrae]|uniref:mandelate racemase/muconate lactonizing enzyme family protein n=1 Tax=Ancylobacter sp. sgz301288 TaxID=3342077 RepID=UPI00385DA126